MQFNRRHTLAALLAPASSGGGRVHGGAAHASLIGGR